MQTTIGAVIYTRVSTEDQAQHGTSLESQRDACRAKVEAMGLPIVCEYQDAGISGALFMARPGLQAALSAVEQGHADTLLCYELSRLSREVKHQQEIKARVEAVGGRLVFCDMTFEDTAEGDLNYVIQGGFKQYERKVIRARTMRGKRKRAEEGQQPQRSRPPYGYHIVTNAQVDCDLYPPAMRGRYIVNEDKAAVARRIYHDYAEGVTLPQLAKALNREGVPTPGNGILWEPNTLHVILTNPAYKGQPVSGRQKCHTDEGRLEQRHKFTGRPITTPDVRCLVPEDERLKLSAPALVEEDMWDFVQQRLEQNRTFRTGNPRQVRMLSGRTFCPHCGGRAILKHQKANGKQYHYFTCGHRRKASTLTGEKPCTGDLYPVEMIEQATLSALQEAWQKPEAIAAAQQQYLRAYRAPSDDMDTLRQELSGVDKALSDLKQEEMVLVRAQIAGLKAGAPAEAYNELFADLAARRKDLENRRGTLIRLLAGGQTERKVSREQQMSQAVQQALEEAWRVLSSPDVEGYVKRDILLELVERVVCRKGGADIVFVPGLFERDGDKHESSIFYTTCIGISTHR